MPIIDSSLAKSTDIAERKLPRGERALAFGVIPAYRRYELRQARYLDLAPRVSAVAEQASDRVLDILDIGSGAGCAKRFVDHHGVTANWTGIEINPGRAAGCLRLGYRQVLDQHDLEQSPLPFDDESFDVIIASHVLEHLLDEEGALSDWYRVLRPGGRLLIGIPMHLGFVASAARLRYRMFGRKPLGHCHFHSQKSLARLLSAFQVRDLRGFRVFSARKWLPLEDYAWFANASMRFGQRWPGLTQEVNLEIRKPS